MVHAILGVRPAAGKEGLGSDSQDCMDQVIILAEKGKEGVSPGTMTALAVSGEPAHFAVSIPDPFRTSGMSTSFGCRKCLAGSGAASER